LFHFCFSDFGACRWGENTKRQQETNKIEVGKKNRRKYKKTIKVKIEKKVLYEGENKEKQ
jgi:hypothetical protein